jgi:hypothetical protein
MLPGALRAHENTKKNRYLAGVFLSLTGFRVGGKVHEIASRRRLDTRQIIPFYDDGGRRYVGVLERTRASRRARGADPLGLEPIGFDFSGVDETGDILSYGRAMFTARAGIELDPSRAPLPLPSIARSIGWTTELALPLLLPVKPTARSIDVSWDGGHHKIAFHEVNELAERIAKTIAAEDFALALPILRGTPRRKLVAAPVRERSGRIADATWLAAAVRKSINLTHERIPNLQTLSFLRLDHIDNFEIITPSHGLSAAVMPYVTIDDEPHFLLWTETRVSALERRIRQPIFDLPISVRHINATARYVTTFDDPAQQAEEVLRVAFEHDVRVVDAVVLGTAEPVPSFGNEVRRRILCALDPDSLGTLPDDAALVAASELARAVSEGVVRDPVIVATLLDLGYQPFTLEGPPTRRAFVDRMTEGSVVQRRLKEYSSIEAEQLESPTYARLMLLLQHEYGVRIAYPRNEADRSFFKAAFRVFMAAPRGDENRALQGLHWSHDAFHFALGNYTLPETGSFADWYLSGDPLPPALPAEGETFKRYVSALKAAEDEATFFSFWQLYEDKESLKQHVSQLTYWEALRRMDITSREEARAIFDDVTTRELLPERVAKHPLYTGEIKSLFEYMLGFRPYHLKDIEEAWRHASRDVYRGFFLRYDIYESDSDKYVASVKSFMDRLAAQPPGLDPLQAMSADVKVAIALRAYDVTKALRLERKSGDRRAALERAQLRLRELDAAHQRLRQLRADIHDAELSPANETRFQALAELADEVDGIRDRIWSNAALPANVIEAERSRELPR